VQPPDHDRVSVTRHDRYTTTPQYTEYSNIIFPVQVTLATHPGSKLTSIQRELRTFRSIVAYIACFVQHRGESRISQGGPWRAPI